MGTAIVSRQQIIDALTAALEPLPFVKGAWLGGSDASGRTDDWSDIDLQLIVDDEAIESTYDVIHTALEHLSPIAERFRFPMPTWHGHEQEILALRDAADCHFLDLVIIARSSSDWFLERERHGSPHVLIDKAGLIEPIPMDREKHQTKMIERLLVLRTTFSLFQNLVTKASRRRAGADAMLSYMSFTVKPLVELLRMRYCPERYDFGLRYLDRDLPAELRDQIDTLVFPGSVAAIEEYRARAEALFEESLKAHDRGEWSLHQP